MNNIQMNSMNTWSSTHNHYRNASILKQLTNALIITNESTLVTNTISINDKTSNESPRTDIKLNIQKLLSEEKPLMTETELTTSPYNFTNGRPCLAGTQTLKHHQITKNQETNLDFTNESMLSLKACDFTQDSSGIGSMISEHCNTPYFKDRDSSDSQLHWQNRSLITLDEDANDMSLNRNDYIAGSCDNSTNNREAPIMKTEYQRLEAQVKRPELAMPTSPPSEGKSTIQCASCDEFDYDTMVAQTRMIANRDFQTIDENLASVARYVEELTGCGESNKSDNMSESQFTKTLPTNRQTTIGKSMYPHQHSHHNLQQQLQQQHTIQSMSSSSASSIRNQQDYQLLKLQQLQQLYQKLISLASMKSIKTDDKNSSESTIQELLLRLLTNQNINETLLNNLLSNVDCVLEKNTRRSLSTVNQNCKQFNNSTNQLSKHNRRVGRNDLTSYDECLLRNILSNASNTSIQSSTNVHGGHNINDNLTTTIHHNNRQSNSIQNSLLSSNYNQLVNLISQLDSNDVTTNLLSQTTSVNTNTVGLLANLLNATQCQPTTSTVNNNSTTLQEQHNLLYSLLANQLASFQSDSLLNSNNNNNNNNNTNISQLLHERETSLLNSTVLKSECQGDISSPSASSSIQRHQYTISDGSLTEELSQLALPYQQLMSSFENDIDKAANVYRNSASTVAQTSEAAYHWSGKLPSRVHRSITYSRKVFLGGVPWDSTSEELVRAFCRFGNVNVCWPQKEISSSTNTYSKPSSTKGYCYLVFEHEVSVSELLANCVHNPTTGGEYYKISSPKFISKDVQVIPWIISDSQYTKSTPNCSDIKRTVFVGALHALITAETLVTIMNDLFGNVVFAALDTDKYKYPIGSGRVIFSSHKSYMKAITANFVDIRTSKFIKTIQIDPYLEDAICNSCLSYPGMYFCRAFECFNYFCPACWHIWHNSTETLNTHKPLRRTFRPNCERQWQTSAATKATTVTLSPPPPPTTTTTTTSPNRF